MSEKITKAFTVTTSKSVMKRFEKLLAMLQFNSGWGHSSTFGMFLDGDGPDRFMVEPKPDPSLAKGVNLIGGVGLDVEIATEYGFTGLSKDTNRNDWWVENDRLYNNGEDWEEKRKRIRERKKHAKR